MIFGQKWYTNFDKAKTKAAKQEKNILMVFSGSDWCIPCMKLEKNIWNSKVFKKANKDHFIFLRVDFPRKKKNQLSKKQKKHNKKLAEKYNKKGYFPLIKILDSTGVILGTTGYKDLKPEEFYQHLISLEQNKK